MKKIPTLFMRNPDMPRLVTDHVHPDCGWVLNGEGVATRKWNGTCTLVSGGGIWKRRQLKPGEPYPPGFVPVEPYPEIPKTGIGWVPCSAEEPDDRWHLEALHFMDEQMGSLDYGTYELIGPKINGNPERVSRHLLVRHGATPVSGLPEELTHASIANFLVDDETGMEGIVWWASDGRRAKIKKRDFGL